MRRRRALPLTLRSSLTLLAHVAFARGRKENVTSLKYLGSRSGHTLRMLTTSSATSSSSGAVLKPNRKCRSVRFPPLQRRKGQREGSQPRPRPASLQPGHWPPGPSLPGVPSRTPRLGCYVE